MKPNEGRIPPECEIVDEHGNVTGWRLVHVRLRCGRDTKAEGLAPWPSKGGRGGDTNWKISRPPFEGDILEWELA